MAADAHAPGLQFTHLDPAEEPGLIKPARTNEKGCLQTAPQQGGKNDLAIRGIAVVERQFHVQAPLHELQHGLEEIPVEPAIALTVVEVPLNRADPVKIED
jgi:hypothetical protein